MVYPRSQQLRYMQSWHLKKKYGITIDEKERLLVAQNFCCAACNSPDPGGRLGWHVDHDHQTGKVRGILCQKCNVALGHAKDNKTRLRMLVNYLERHQ